MIDEFTYNDLELDELIDKYRKCLTTAGDDIFIERLNNPFTEKEKEFFDLKEYYYDSVNNKKDFNLFALGKIGKFKYGNFKNTVIEMANKPTESNGFHYGVIVAILISFSLIFIIPGPGFLLFMAAVALALFSYFAKNKELADKFYVFKYIVRLLKDVDDSYRLLDKESDAEKLFDEILEIKKLFAKYLRGQFLIKTNESTEGNPVDIFLDYIRMIFHLDIIKYNSMHKVLSENTDKIFRLYDIIGMIDCAVAVNKLENEIDCCKVEYTSENLIKIENGYHPLVENPVANSIDTDKNILITGCNASGKSTYLKMISIIVIFAEAFGFTFAKSCKINRYNVLSSMAIKDSLKSGESYFTAELNSIKRIINKVNSGDMVLCVIDEILRGTNTVERIAASTEILKSLCGNNVICIGATHDIELTKLLRDSYENWHFEEDITDSDIKFSYKICKGPSESRNAIKLLSIMGYDEQIVNEAESRAKAFAETGAWA